MAYGEKPSAWDRIKGGLKAVGGFVVKKALPFAAKLAMAHPIGAAATAAGALGAYGIHRFIKNRKEKKEQALGAMADTYDSEYDGDSLKKSSGLEDLISQAIAKGKAGGGGGGKGGHNTKDLAEKYKPEEENMKGLSDAEKAERIERRKELFKELGMGGPSPLEQVGGAQGLVNMMNATQKRHDERMNQVMARKPKFSSPGGGKPAKRSDSGFSLPSSELKIEDTSKGAAEQLKDAVNKQQEQKIPKITMPHEEEEKKKKKGLIYG
jgi:uncharacterized protein YfiM (DUF2279 family)